MYMKKLILLALLSIASATQAVVPYELDNSYRIKIIKEIVPTEKTKYVYLQYNSIFFKNK